MSPQNKHFSCTTASCSFLVFTSFAFFVVWRWKMVAGAGAILISRYPSEIKPFVRQCERARSTPWRYCGIRLAFSSRRRKPAAGSRRIASQENIENRLRRGDATSDRYLDRATTSTLFRELCSSFLRLRLRLPTGSSYKKQQQFNQNNPRTKSASCVCCAHEREEKKTGKMFEKILKTENHKDRTFIVVVGRGSPRWLPFVIVRCPIVCVSHLREWTLSPRATTGIVYLRIVRILFSAASARTPAKTTRYLIWSLAGCPVTSMTPASHRMHKTDKDHPGAARTDFSNQTYSQTFARALANRFVLSIFYLIVFFVKIYIFKL